MVSKDKHGRESGAKSLMLSRTCNLRTRTRINKDKDLGVEDKDKDL